tara:strand:+ start:802 stop:1143 length:342 start_codon:yes stop_codon:yes gene_type:complete
MNHWKKRRQGPKTKKKVQQNHAKRRFLERYGFDLTPSSEKKIVSQIMTSSNAEFVRKTSNRKSVWRVYYQDGSQNWVFLVVYDKQRKSLVTCLPLDKSIEKSVNDSLEKILVG